jgi:DNA-binding LytR/AlgR family response regulator
MPGLDGLGVAAELADAWPIDQAPMPHLVFVTAYDEYAARAFDAQAIDYVLKPVQPERLRRTVSRVHAALEQRSLSTDDALASTLAEWRKALAAAESAPNRAPLTLIPASLAGSSGQSVRMVSVSEVLYFEAADKYVRVVTARDEYLIRTPLKQLLPQLDAQVFWQVHRAVVVRSDAIESVYRDETGKQHLTLRGRDEKIPVSRLYAPLFKAM